MRRTHCHICGELFQGPCIVVGERIFAHAHCYESLKNCSVCGYARPGRWCEECAPSWGDFLISAKTFDATDEDPIF